MSEIYVLPIPDATKNPIVVYCALSHYLLYSILLRHSRDYIITCYANRDRDQ
jgi:hypothetical protein